MENSVHNSNLAQKIEPQSEYSRPELSTVASGTNVEKPSIAEKGQSTKMDPLDEITQRKTKRQHIREFGQVIALALVVIAGLKLWRGGNPNVIIGLCAAAIVFCLLCSFAPRAMSPVFKAWMLFGGVLERIMTPLILGAMWFATFFPIGIVFKIIGKSPMTLGFEPSRQSYWEDCSSDRNDFGLLERQY